jgi:hypothetical protein
MRAALEGRSRLRALSASRRPCPHTAADDLSMNLVASARSSGAPDGDVVPSSPR